MSSFQRDDTSIYRLYHSGAFMIRSEKLVAAGGGKRSARYHGADSRIAAHRATILSWRQSESERFMGKKKAT